MPEIAEVETVKKRLNNEVLNKRIKNVKIIYNKTIESDIKEFQTKLINEKFTAVLRRGKYLIFQTDHYDIVSHLRMEGRFYYKPSSDPVLKHEHVIITFDDDTDLRYYDSRKFGRMCLLNKGEYINYPGIKKLGIEANSKELTAKYLNDCLKNKTIAIKTALLDQTIISGLGNIYDNEVLFVSGINPTKPANKVTMKECEKIVANSKIIVDEAIKCGGTTIHSFESALGVTGGYQDKLLVHGNNGKPCRNCQTLIKKIKVNGRGTYYCPKCQK